MARGAEQGDEAVGRPDFVGPVGGGGEGNQGGGAGQQGGGGRVVFRGDPGDRQGWVGEAEGAGQVGEAVAGAAAAAHDGASAGGQQQGEGRAAQIDGEVPARADAGRPEGGPMQVEPALVDDQQALQAGHAGKHAGGDGAAGDGKARLGVGAQQVGKQAGGEDRVAEAGGGDEQDAHAGVGVAVLPPRCECPTCGA